MESYYLILLGSIYDAESKRNLYDNDSPENHDPALFEKSVNPL